MNLEDLSNKEIMVIAVARLRGATRTVDTEDAAVEADLLLPGRFRWKKHKERIDLETARDGLRLAAMASPPLLAGTPRDGWTLTSEGRDWINALPAGIRRKGLVSGKRQEETDGKLEQEAERMRKTEAWRKFQEGKKENITLPDYHEFARLNSYFPPRQRRERLSIVGNAAQSDPKLWKLWNYLLSHFEKEERK